MKSIRRLSRWLPLLTALYPLPSPAHGGEALVVLPLFLLFTAGVSFAMAVLWLSAGLLVGVFLSGLLTRLTGRKWLLYVSLPLANVVAWFVAYPFLSMVPQSLFGGEGAPDLSHPLRPAGLYLTAIAVPTLIVFGLATAAALKLVARLLRRGGGPQA